MDNESLPQLDHNTARIAALEHAISALLIALNLSNNPEIIGRFDIFIAAHQAGSAIAGHTPAQLQAQRDVFQQVRDSLFPPDTHPGSLNL